MKPRDYAYEALAETTSTDQAEGRGALNAALKSIREQSGIEDSYILAAEIHDRARAYRELMPEVMLTPNALAKHWLRVFEETEQRKVKVKGVNLHSESECATCGGDRFVDVGTYPSELMKRAMAEGKDTSGIEGHGQVAPCPDCNHQDISYYRFNGTRFTPPDPGRVREMMDG